MKLDRNLKTVITVWQNRPEAEMPKILIKLTEEDCKSLQDAKARAKEALKKRDISGTYKTFVWQPVGEEYKHFKTFLLTV
jgi:hypothetical protein